MDVESVLEMLEHEDNEFFFPGSDEEFTFSDDDMTGKVCC